MSEAWAWGLTHPIDGWSLQNPSLSSPSRCQARAEPGPSVRLDPLLPTLPLPHPSLLSHPSSNQLINWCQHDGQNLKWDPSIQSQCMMAVPLRMFSKKGCLSQRPNHHKIPSVKGTREGGIYLGVLLFLRRHSRESEEGKVTKYILFILYNSPIEWNYLKRGRGQKCLKYFLVLHTHGKVWPPTIYHFAGPSQISKTPQGS